MFFLKNVTYITHFFFADTQYCFGHDDTTDYVVVCVNVYTGSTQ